MSENKIDYDWVKNQFALAKVRLGTGKAVLELLELWEKSGIPVKDANQICEILAKMVQGHSLVQVEPEGVWVQAERGFIGVSDRVRIKGDAFTGSQGMVLNNRLATVTALRSGDIIIKTIDDRPVVDGLHIQPEKLEKRVQ